MSPATCLAILRKKNQNMRPKLPDDILIKLAKRAHTSVSKLEGTLTSAVAKARHTRQNVTTPTARTPRKHKP
jgi:chromosomal replication initiation ATPase DnaA